MSVPFDPKGIVPLADVTSSLYRRFVSVGHTAQEAQALTRMRLDAVLSNPVVVALISAQMKGKAEEEKA